MAIEPISAISASQRAQALTAAQEVPAGTVAATQTNDAAQRAAQAAQLQTGLPQEAAAQAAAREAAAAARAADVLAGRDANAQTQAAQARDAVRQAVIDSRATTAARQGGLAPLFADLAEAVRSEAAPPQTSTSPSSPPQTPAAPTSPAPPVAEALPLAVRQAIDRVLALQLPAGDVVTAASLRQAVERSGLFLEARLAVQADASPQTDLKAALLALKQTLTAAAQQPPPSAAEAEPPPLQNRATPLPSPVEPGPEASDAPPGARQTAPPAFAAMPPEEPALAATPREAARTTGQSSAVLSAQNAATPEAEGPAAQTQAAATLAQQGAPTRSQPPPEPEPTPAPTPVATARQTTTQSLLSGQQAAAEAALTETAEQADQQAARQIALATQTVQTVQAAQATQAAQPTALDIARMVSQSSLLLAAQEAAMPDEDERRLNPPRPGTPAAKDDIAPVARILGLQPVPPVRDSALGGQPPTLAVLSRAADSAAVVQHLSHEVDQALARQTLHQLESLKAGGATEGTAATWMFEIPIATPQGTAIAQFEIDRDGRRMGGAGAGPGWRARFAIDVEPLGPVHVHLSMNGGQTAATVYAERPGSLERLRAQGETLARELSGEVVFHTGAPRRPVATRGHFVDQTT